MKMIESNLPETMTLRVYHQHTEHGKLDSTLAVVYDKQSGETLGIGHALVNHRKEKSPSRKIGRAVAVGRAMTKALGRKKKFQLELLDKEEYYINWDKFVNTGEFQFDD